MKWIINSILEDSSLEELLKEKNIEYKSIYYKDFSSIKEFCEDDLVLFHGTLNDAKYLKQTTNCTTYCNLEKFKCTSYYPHFNKFLLNYPYSIVTFKDLQNKLVFNSLMRTFGQDGCIFVRPNKGEKIFTGKVLDIRNIERDIKYLNFYDTVDEELVLVSEPKNIRAEWRFWIAGNDIIGHSMYQPVKLEYVHQPVIDYVNNVLKNVHWRPEGLFVIDICETSDGFSVLELNSFGCSGFYKVNLAEMIPAAMKFAQKEYDIKTL